MSNKQIKSLFILFTAISVLSLGIFIFNKINRVEKDVRSLEDFTDNLKVSLEDGNEPILGDIITSPNFFKISSSSLTITNPDRDFYIGDGTASSSATAASVSFAVDPKSNILRIRGHNYLWPNSTGSNGQVLHTDGGSPFQTLTWDTDDSGGGGGGATASASYIEIRENSLLTTNFRDFVTSLSFNDGAFDLTASGTQDVRINLDWTNGPASLSQAETITGNWVNTTNPWADNEVVDTLTINGGTVTWTDLTTYPTGCTNQFVTAVGDTLTCASVDISANTNLTAGAGLALTDDDMAFDATELDALTWDAGSLTSFAWTFNLTSGDPVVTWTQSGASLSLNFEAVGYASASSYFGKAFYTSGTEIDCNDAAEGLQWSAGIFTCRTWADADIPDAITIDGGTLNDLSIGSAKTWTTTGTLTIGDGGDVIDFNTSTWDITSGAVVGFTSLTLDTATTGVLLDTDGDGMLIIQGQGNGNDEDIRFNLDDTADTVVLTSTTSLVNWDFGSIGIDLDSAYLKLPNNGTIDAEGEISWHTTSDSLDIYDGSNTRVIRSQECFTYYIEDPTSSNDKWIGHKRFNDPFTIVEVLPNASGSNAAGWNLYYGNPGSNTTAVFTNNKSASTSLQNIKYTSFANSALLEGYVMDVVITSTSATLQSFSVNVCGRYNH